MAVNLLKKIDAWETTDGKRFLDINKANLRQDILDRKDKPCDKCECSGKCRDTNHGPAFMDTCPDCNGHGYLVRKWVKLDPKKP